MKIKFLPSSKLGKITLYLALASMLLWLGMIGASSFFQLPYEEAFTSGGSWLLMGLIVSVTATNVLCFFTGLVAILKHKDYSVLVIIATLAGANMLFTLITLVYRSATLL